MTGLTNEQQQAFEAACEVIDRARAHEILQLKNWQHGMCGCLNAVKPHGSKRTRERGHLPSLEDASRMDLLDECSLSRLQSTGTSRGVPMKQGETVQKVDEDLSDLNQALAGFCPKLEVIGFEIINQLTKEDAA